jgi:hypothetical protein
VGEGRSEMMRFSGVGADHVHAPLEFLAREMIVCAVFIATASDALRLEKSDI